MNNYLIIGENGFIGRSLLGLNGSTVNTFTPISKIFGKNPRLYNIAESIINDSSVFEPFNGILILAGSLKPSSSLESYIIASEQEAIPIIKIAEKASANNKRIIYVSSAGSLYRNELGTNENSRVSPINYYGLLKKNIEDSLIMMSNSIGLNYQIYRVSNVYGQGQILDKNQGLMAALYEAASKGNDFNLYTSLSSKKDYIHIYDLVNTIDMLISSPAGVYNIGSGVSTSISEMVKIFEKVSCEKININVEFIDKSHANIHNLILDISKIKKIMPFTTFKKIEDGVREYYEWSQTRALNKFI